MSVVQSPQIPTTWHRQELLTYIFFAALLLLIALSAKAAYQYTLPQPQWIKVGNIADFRQDQPVLIDLGKMNVWVVNREDRINVFNPLSYHRVVRCTVYWDREQQVLVEPCLGAKYTLNGIYADGGPPPLRMLDRYTVRVAADGTLSIETTKPILGMTFDQLVEICSTRTRVSTGKGLWGWLPNCPFHEILPTE